MSSNAMASPAPFFGALTRVLRGVVAGPLEALEVVEGPALESNNLTVSRTLLLEFLRSPEVGLTGPEARVPKGLKVGLLLVLLGDR